MAISGYNTVTAFFDESGKPADHEVIVIGGVASFNEYFVDFASEWGRLLYLNGLQVLSCKSAFRANYPLSRKNDRVGLEKRIEDLLPFINCIRKHLQVVIGMAIDVTAFKKLPSHFYQTFGDDPEYVCFARSMLHVVEFTPDKDKICLTCDDEEKTGVNFFRLYRQVKRNFPEARKKCVAISFADDKYLFALQAADLVCGLIRLESEKELLNRPYDYSALFERLKESPEKHEDLWQVFTVIADGPKLENLAIDVEKQRMVQLDAERERVSNLRPVSSRAAKGFSRGDQGKVGRREKEKSPKEKR